MTTRPKISIYHPSDIIMNKSKQTREELDSEVKEYMADHPEMYKIWEEYGDEYLEWLEQVSKDCQEDKELVEDIVMNLQEKLNAMSELLAKPGWEALCYEVEIRNFQAEFLDGTFQPNPVGFFEFPEMGDKEMAEKTGLTRARIVQETKRVCRKFGNKLEKEDAEVFKQYLRDKSDDHGELHN